MLSAIFEHIYRLFTFNHNGQGLKTSKYFTFILIFVCFVLSYVSRPTDEVDMGFIIFDFILLAIIYFLNINKKETINATFFVIAIYLAASLLSVWFGYIVLFWGFLALNVMNVKRRNS